MALSPFVRPVAYCENDRYAQAVLLSRMQSGDLPTAPIWDDITTLLPSMLPRNGIDIIYGGFPCQPYSTAARGKNKPDTLRHHFERIVDAVKPKLVFAENVSLEAFREVKFAQRYDILVSSAASVGAPHIRKRYWMLAYPNSERKSALPLNVEVGRGEETTETFWQSKAHTGESLRMADGLSFWPQRIKCLGNAVVPAQAREAFIRLMTLEKATK